MTQENKQERIVILSKAYGVKWELNFFEQIEEAILDGYRIARTGLRDDASMRHFRGRLGRAILYLEGCEPEAWKPAVVEATVEVKEEIQVKEETVAEDLSTGAPENTPIEKELTLLEQLEEITDYKDLKAFAEKNEIEIPAKTYNPKAVKKVIKKALKD